MSSYVLAIDVGTSRIAAAGVRRAGAPSDPVAVPLGRQRDTAPTCVFAARDGLLFGDAAERRALAQPERLLRDFPRRIGDDTPLLAGDERFTPEQLLARTVEWVVEIASEREGSAPAALALVRPAGWSDERAELVQRALAEHGWDDVRLVPALEASAELYDARHPLEAGGALVVYDLGAGGFTGAVLRKTDDGFVVVGDPVATTAFGGLDVDDLVLRHVLATAGIDPRAVASDPAARYALAALRRDAVDAKEALSFDAETVVPVLLPGDHDPVRLTRDELEGMIEEPLRSTVDALGDLLERSGVAPSAIAAVLLVGGASRTPRVAQLLSESFDRPLALDADPKATAALGAAAVLAGSAAHAASDAVVADPATEEATAGLAPTPVRKRRLWRPATAAYTSAGAAAVIAVGALLAQATSIGTPTGTPVPAAAEAFAGTGADGTWAPTDRTSAGFSVGFSPFDPIAAVFDPLAVGGSRFGDAPRATTALAGPGREAPRPAAQPASTGTAPDGGSAPQSATTPQGPGGGTGPGAAADPGAPTGTTDPGTTTPSDPPAAPTTPAEEPAPQPTTPVDPAPVDPGTPAPVDPAPEPAPSSATPPETAV